jgi:hypothetical protein
VSERKEETEAYEKKRKKYVCRRRKMITNEKTAINENEQSGDDDDGGQRPREGKKPATLHYGMSPSEKCPLQYVSRNRNLLNVKLQWSVSEWHCRTRSAQNCFFHSVVLHFELKIILLIFIVFLIL